MSSWLLCPKIHHSWWKGNFLLRYTEMTTYSPSMTMYNTLPLQSILEHLTELAAPNITLQDSDRQGAVTNKKKVWYKERQKGLICWFTSWRILRVESFILSNSSMQHMPLSASTNAPLWDKVTLFVIWKINWKINTTVLETTGQQSILSSQWDRY